MIMPCMVINLEVLSSDWIKRRNVPGEGKPRKLTARKSAIDSNQAQPFDGPPSAVIEYWTADNLLESCENERHTSSTSFSD